jgi:hypothetical protein
MLRATTSINTFSALSYQGTWNASTNTPTLVSSVGTAGYYYIVSVAGSTSLNGISTWNVGDWVIFSNTGVWQKISGGVTGSISVTNDTTSNTNYNLTLSNINSGTASGVYVDSPNLTFNPSTGTFSSPAVFIGKPGIGVIPLVISAENASVSNLEPTIGVINSDWLQISFYDNLSPDASIYNYSLFADEEKMGFWMSSVNSAYNRGNPVFQVNQYGATQFGSASGSISGFGTAGQVLISQGSSSYPIWGGIKTTATTYSGLGSAATAGAGARGFITDSTTATFLATAAGGGSNAVPVVSNGTNWLVG